MNVFDALDGAGLAIPDAPGVSAWGESLELAWQRGGMGEYVGQVIDAAASNAMDAVDSVLDSIPMDAVPLGGAVLEIALSAISNQHKRVVSAGRYNMAVGCMAIVGAGAFSAAVNVPSYTDCSDLGNARRRTVVTPQRTPAAWYPGGPYREPEGNCGSGYAVWCGQGFGNVKKPGAGGKRCHGDADGSALLYPWWTGAAPPGPMPIGPDQGPYGPKRFNPNATVARRQSAYLTSPVLNFRLDRAELVAMRARLLERVGWVAELADQRDSYTVTSSMAQVGVGAIDAVLQARAAWARSEVGLGLVSSPRAAVRVHPTAREDVAAAQSGRQPAPAVSSLRAPPRDAGPPSSGASPVAVVAGAGLLWGILRALG